MARQDKALTLTLAIERGRESVSVPRLSVVLEQPGKNRQERKLVLSPVVVGSASSCDLVCDDPRVSRSHCRFQLAPEGVLVTDLNSKNGTFVGGVRIREVVLSQPMAVRLGGSNVLLLPGDGEDVIPLSSSNHFGEAFGASVEMRALFAMLERAAGSDLPVLLGGESGTGKELMARAIHAKSARADQPFVIVDCGSLSQQLAEGELFGYEQGAFTGAVRSHVGLLEQAHGGTVFLDEVGELPPALQPRLMRALEARKVRRLGSNEDRPAHFRIVAATHRDLRTLVAAGEFRQDLLFRLNGLEARIPPLRERKEDIPLLVEHILKQAEQPRRLSDLAPNALDLLMAHTWPGNVRELRNTVTRWALFPELTPTAATPAVASSSKAPWGHLSLREARDAAVESFERGFVAGKLAEAGGNVAAAARSMDVSRQFLYRLLARYDLRGSGD